MLLFRSWISDSRRHHPHKHRLSYLYLGPPRHHTIQQKLFRNPIISKNRIDTYQESSPSYFSKAVDQLSKAAQAIAHRVTLMDAEVHTLREANMALSKCRRAKRTRVQDGENVSVLDAQNVLAEKAWLMRNRGGGEMVVLPNGGGQARDNMAFVARQVIMRERVQRLKK